MVNFAIFNSYKFIETDEINDVLKRSNSRLKIPEILKYSGFQRISENRLSFLMDCGKPTPEKTHASSLSFEFSHGSEKIVVNCGSPFINNKKLSEALRSTAAHSTISIDDINSSDIFFEKIAPQGLQMFGLKNLLISITLDKLCSFRIQGSFGLVHVLKNSC